MTTRDRRAFLAAGGTALAAALAGCGSAGGSGKDAASAAGTSGQELSDVTVLNRTDTTQTVDLRVARDGKVVYWARHDLAAQSDGGTLDVGAPDEWTAEPGEYVVELHRAGDTAGGDVTRWSTPSNPEATCATLLFAVTADSVNVWTGKKACGTGGGNATNASE